MKLNSALYKFVFFMLSSLLLNPISKAESIDVTFLYVGDKNNSAYLGAEQGLSEANLQGEFLGQKYSIKLTSSNEIASQMDDTVVAIVAADTAETLNAIANANPNTAVLNVTADNNDLRKQCIANQLHIGPSQQMKNDALNQWLEKEPNSQAVAQAWHPEFKKFAARDLNKRFKKQFGVPMDDGAWAGWAAIKMVSDTVARENITDRKAILDFLKNKLAFDGQKGLNMSFRETGQLRQPILIVEDDKILTEAPVRGVANPPTVESLGILNCNN